MRYSRSIGKEPNFTGIIIFSAVLHAVFISSVVIPVRTGEREFRSYQVTLVGPMKSPAAVHTPVKEAKKEKAAPGEVVLPPPKPDISLEPVEKVTKEIERLRAISGLKKQKKGREKSQETRADRQGEAGASSRPLGIPGGGPGEIADSYYGLITRKIWEQWIYPSVRATRLEVIISIRIDREGNVTYVEVEKPSGDALFDRSAVKAVTKASPLPPPPLEMEIGLRFYL